MLHIILKKRPTAVSEEIVETKEKKRQREQMQKKTRLSTHTRLPY